MHPLLLARGRNPRSHPKHPARPADAMGFRGDAPLLSQGVTSDSHATCCYHGRRVTIIATDPADGGGEPRRGLSPDISIRSRTKGSNSPGVRRAPAHPKYVQHRLDDPGRCRRARPPPERGTPTRLNCHWATRGPPTVAHLRSVASTARWVLLS